MLLKWVRAEALSLYHPAQLGTPVPFSVRTADDTEPLCRRKYVRQVVE